MRPCSIGTESPPGPEPAAAVRFEMAEEPGSEVFVAGSFNHWDSRSHRLLDPSGTGAFQVVVALPPGRHEYKFIVNGRWRNDPKCPETVLNPFGSLNSVVSVIHNQEVES